MSLQNVVDDVCFVFQNIPNQVPFRDVRQVDLNSDFTCNYLFGLLSSTEQNVVSTGAQILTQRLSLQEARDSIGEWFGIFKRTNEDTWIIAADQFGYQPVYYRYIDSASSQHGALLIGSSAAAVAYTASTLNDKSVLDATQVHSVIGTKHAWGITMQSHHAMSQGTFILLPGEEIAACEQGWTLIDSTLHNEENLDYDSLLDVGTERAIKQIQVASQLGVDQKHINLSGGRDSRMVMAILSASGLAKDFSITTMNPETWLPESARPLLWQDLYVSSAIGDHFGMDWSPAFDTEYAPLSFNESLDLWQQFRAHKNFGFKARRGIFLQKGTNIELRGAAGETFRGFQAVSALEAQCEWSNTPDSLESDLDLVVENIYSLGLLSPEDLLNQRRSLDELVEKFSATTVESFLHRRYSVFRNRSHFGHVRESMANGQIPILPLSQPEFYKAGLLLGESTMRTDKIAFDLIERLDPSLNKLRFDDGGWSPEFAARASSNATWSVPEEGDRLRRFSDIDTRAVEARRGVRSLLPQKRINHGKFDANFKSKNEAKEVMYDLASMPGGDTTMPARLRSRLTKMLDSGTLPPTTLLAKLTSARDAVLGKKSTIISVNADEQQQLAAHRNYANVTQTIVRQSKLNPEFQVPARIEGGVFKAVVRIFGNIRGPVEYGFELIDEQGTSLATRRFEESNSVSFDEVNLTNAGRVRVKIVARYKITPEIRFEFFSAYKSL